MPLFRRRKDSKPDAPDEEAVRLTEHVYEKARNALDAIPLEERHDIYVVSFLVTYEEDDPRRPTITVGFNTERDVVAAMNGESAGFGLPSGQREARWNYAFYKQNALVTICDTSDDPEGASRWQSWARRRGYWYSDAEAEADFEATLKLVARLAPAFVACALDVVRRLHADGDVVRIFGRPIPVVVHEFEYYDEIAEQNRVANPPGLVDDFAHFCRHD
jgi:hypothetical protein